MNPFRLEPSRYKSRSSQEQQKIQEALNSAQFCTLAFVREGRSVCLPTGYCFDEQFLYIHGSIKSGFLLDLLALDEVCINAFSAQALVLAPTAFDHSINYLSINIYAKAEEVFETKEKQKVLESFTDRYIPGRMADLEEISNAHLVATRVLRFSLETSIVKERSGQASYPELDAKPEIWCGIIPMKTSYEEAIPDERSRDLGLPKYFA